MRTCFGCPVQVACLAVELKQAPPESGAYLRLSLAHNVLVAYQTWAANILSDH